MPPKPSGPPGPPIGVQLTNTARAVSRAFDAALAAAGGSLPTWQVLLALKTRSTANQRELAAAVGIQGATLTHHLNGMEADGLLTRRRDPANRRVHLVELTDEGEAAFRRLRDVAVAHDRRLRAGLDDRELEVVRGVLARMLANVTEGTTAGDDS
ncbi:MarR family winged helix-turn-helix transcriptional regulator [Actinopolymorpha singaporensis]